MIRAGIRRRNTKISIGFTLIEIIVSLAILGILAGVAIPLYAGYIDQARTETCIADIKGISLALTNYYADNGNYPDSLAEVGYATYRDCWGKNPYRYLNIKTAKNKGSMRKDRFLVPINSDFDLYSMGKDGESTPPLTAQKSRDDIIRANDGAYVGLAYAF
jgi:general secretion pathway protein G